MEYRSGGALPTGLLILGLIGCGSAKKAGVGDYCEQDSDCQAGLVCKQNICIVPGSGNCDPPCSDDEVCREGKCEPINPSLDQDGDGFTRTEDCDDFDPFTYPADPQTGTPGGFEYCDGKDNDCDGQTDEGCPPCRQGDSQPCGTDLGECTAGIQTCTDGVWGACSGQGPQAEKADGLDNDCDGSVDEGLPCQAGQTRACGTDEGECSPGTQACSPAGVWEACGGAMPTPELCDGQDNDCDGTVDDGFMPGQACDGRGECGVGVYECAEPRAFHCSTEAGGSQDQSRSEWCDGLDDDCDGEIDEDYGVGQGCLGTGMCGNGFIECRDLHTADCSSNPGGSQDRSQPEVCDGLDNDCDGASDEDFRVGEACTGQGVCGQGTLECASTSTTRCSTEPGGSQDQSGREVCDGQDNDCDGETDEGSDRDLCQPFPPHVVNAVCERGLPGCRLTNPGLDCELGWWDFNGDYADGCELSDDGAGNSCAAAVPLEAVSDFGGGGRVTVSGQLVPAGDEDWYAVTGIDDVAQDEQIDGCDNYRVKISFTQRPEGVVFDVATDSCTEAGCHQDIEYEFFTDYRDQLAGLGECPCTLDDPPPAGINRCEQKSHTFFIRVYRLGSYPINDAPYTLEITNGI